ncbi:MAG TPA: hypothetical protein DCL08_01610 [Anaerolineaceae bacterium]|jgi:hypothetical protein|nr:hypothetical protein [Anaerolineaceae bacterium]
MSFPKSIRILLSLGTTLLLLLTACATVPEATATDPSSSLREETTSPTDTPTPVETAETAALTSTRPNDGELHVDITWAYRDAERLGVEIAVTNYPLPERGINWPAPSPRWTL